MYRQILYSSRATDTLTMGDVFGIIRTSHNRNSRAGLTGGLLFIDGCFFQILEGSPYAVEERYKVIEADPRHSDVCLREDVLVDSLSFPDEWMALKDGAQLPHDLLAAHGYEPSLPTERFDSSQVRAFLFDCFAHEEQPTRS